MDPQYLVLEVPPGAVAAAAFLNAQYALNYRFVAWFTYGSTITGGVAIFEHFEPAP